MARTTISTSFVAKCGMCVDSGTTSIPASATFIGSSGHNLPPFRCGDDGHCQGIGGIAINSRN
ncbi:hypothetical protein CDL15_Pgr004235 [Punica granatum]|nr:hypothetical protein CDL15_Pgr004235 [Punica granatum]